MPSTRTFGVIGVDCAPFEGGQGGFDESRFIQSVRVNSHLYVKFIGYSETGVDGGRRGSPVFVEFQADGAGPDLFTKRLWG